MKSLFACWVIMLSLFATAAHAAARASLQPERIALGQTTTLTIESDDSAAAPDYSALQGDFDVRGQSTSTQVSIVNGRSAARTVFSVELEPRKAGVIGIPPLRVGSVTTEPLSLTVTPGEQGSAEHGDALYIETELGSEQPYVQQSVSYRVRLFYSVELLNGDVQAPAPENATLQKIGEDRNYEQQVNGLRYKVFERNFLLTPEKSGPLELPAAVFRGRAQVDSGGFFGSVRAVSAAGKARTLNVRPQPPNAPAPWLAVNKLQLTRNDVPDSARAGDPLMIEMSLAADGATVAQLPELQLPAIDGAQVFPEPAQSKDTIVDGKPHAIVSRRFAVVPARPGSMRIPALRLNYWNTQRDAADSAELPERIINIGAGITGNAGAPAAPIAPLASPAGASAPSTALRALPAENASAVLRVWQMLCAALTVALLLVALWGWRRGRRAPAVGLPAPGAVADRSALRSALARALAEGDLDAIAEALRRSMTPPCTSLGAFVAQLDSQPQRDAVAALERVLWAAGVDASERQATREQLRAAFRNGPSLRAPETEPEQFGLPALYPKRS